jgi:hypothetical protein
MPGFGQGYWQNSWFTSPRLVRQSRGFFCQSGCWWRHRLTGLGAWEGNGAWQRRLAALFVFLALAGCASLTAGPGRRRTCPISKAILATPAECTRAGSPDGEPISKPGPAVPNGARPLRVSPAEQVQFFPASKQATGTALDISLPSIRNTRPCDADSRVFNAS